MKWMKEGTDERDHQSPVGYEGEKCEIKLSGCEKTGAGYGRYKKFARVGPILNACETCARQPYEQPPQLAKEGNKWTTNCTSMNG